MVIKNGRACSAPTVGSTTTQSTTRDSRPLILLGSDASEAEEEEEEEEEVRCHFGSDWLQS